MRLLKAIGTMLAGVVLACIVVAVLYAWASLCSHLSSGWGVVIYMAPFIILLLVSITWLLYEVQE